MIWKRWERHADAGLLIVRLSLGLGFFFFRGWDKITAGPERWESLGSVMETFGIGFGHTFFGFMAAFSESIGALCIALGLFFQPVLALLTFTMLMAASSHLTSGRGSPAHALTYAGIALGLIFTGPGKYSLDALLQRRMDARGEGEST